MNKQDLWESFGDIDEDILERSERNKVARRRRVPRAWMSAAAAVLLVGVLVCVGPLRSLVKENSKDSIKDYGETNSPSGDEHLHGNSSSQIGEDGQNSGSNLFDPNDTGHVEVLGMAAYPEMVPFPEDDCSTEAMKKWNQSLALQSREQGYADKLTPFFKASVIEILKDANGENAAFSPVNFYMALSLLAETAAGESRQEILDLMGCKDIEELRKLSSDVWNSNYCKDGMSTSLLANSLWLRDDVNYKQEAIDSLVKNYYASVSVGKMGSSALNTALQEWMNEQTGGLLKDMIYDPRTNILTKSDTQLVLASTINFQVRWWDEFHKAATKEGVFYGTKGDTTVSFMYGEPEGCDCYEGNNFVAVRKKFGLFAGHMGFFLPKDGESLEALLKDDELMEFLSVSGKWEGFGRKNVELVLPRFDISSQINLSEKMPALGITAVFDGGKADFSSISEQMGPGSQCIVSRAIQGVRIQVHEEGVAAAGFTDIFLEKGVPSEGMKIVFDRPFLFAIYGRDGLPMFVGVVNQIEE